MITNVRIGNDIKLIWQILKGGQPVDLTGATDVKVSVFQGGNSSCGNVYIDTFKITDAVNGILSVEIPKEVITEVGYMWTVLEYTLHDDDMIDGDRKVTVDNVPVRIVSLTAEASQVYEFNVSSDILAGFHGKSAFEVWLTQNPDKTEEDYFNWLQKPATDIAETVGLQEQARVEAENTRKNNEEQRVEAELLRQTNTQEAILNAENATENANTAAQNADNARLAIQDDLALKASHGYESNPKTLKEVDESVNDVRDGLDTLGLEQVLGYNFIEHLYGISRGDTEVWGNGYLADDGSVVVSEDWLHTRDYIPIYKGTYDVNILLRSNACLLIYNNKKEVVKAEKNIGQYSTTQGRNITIEESGFIRFSYPTYLDEGGAYIPLEGRHFINTSAIILSDNSVFLKTNEAEKLIPDTVNTILSYYGLTPILPGNNFISELTGSSVLDTSLWDNGFLTSSGGIFTGANWYHSKKYYRLPRGSYQMFFWVSGNAKILVYDENKESIVRVLEKSGSIDGKQFNETFDQDVYLRISHREGEGTEGRTNDIYVVNTANVYDKITASINIDDKVTVGSDKAVASGAVPTFMRDIYKKMNPPKTKRPIVTFIADDGHINDKNWYIPLLDEYNVKSTHAIVKKYVVGADNGEYVNRLNSEDIINLHKDGHDIASHTINHLNLNQMTLEEADNEVGGNKVFLQDLINDDIPMFVSPFGGRNANLDEVIARYHKANFISGYGVRNETPIDSYFINRVSFDTMDNNVLLWENSLLPALESCLENSEWLVFAVHPGYSTYTSSNPVYMERRNELRLIIEWCNTNDVQIMTAKNAYNYWRNPVEIGVKRKDVNYYRLGMDGTEEGQGILM